MFKIRKLLSYLAISAFGFFTSGCFQSSGKQPVILSHDTVTRYFPSIQFNAGSSVVSEAGYGIIREICAELNNKGITEAHIVLTGGTSAEGPRALNNKLAQNRIDSVRKGIESVAAKYGIKIHFDTVNLTEQNLALEKGDNPGAPSKLNRAVYVQIVDTEDIA